MDKIKTGDMIRQARNRKGYTQSELGILLGVTNKAVSRWENGDSFPDVGVLEQLSNVLELSIQDIVTGEVGGNSDEAVGEIVRVARIQGREKRNRMVVLCISGFVLLMLLLPGYWVFTGCSIFSTAFYFYFLALVLMVLSVKCIIDGKLAKPFKEKISKWCSILGIVTGIYAVAGIVLTFFSINHGKIPFNMELSSVGPFLNGQLVLVFVLNAICLAVESFRVGWNKQNVHVGMYVMVFNIFLTMVYSALLHNLVSPQDFYRIFILDTVVAAAETAISFGMMLLLNRVKNKD